MGKAAVEKTNHGKAKAAKAARTGEMQVSVGSLKLQMDLQERIRRRAYELYELRGDDGADELQDWLRAEAEITAELGKK